MPTFDELFGYVLAAHSDGKVHSVSDVRNTVIPQLNLTKEELEEVLPSGRETRISNRIGWSKSYLVKAGLLEKAGYGKNRITAEGLKLLNSGRKIDLNCLSEYDSFKQSSFSKQTSNPVAEECQTNHVYTPDEVLITSVKDINEKLTDELLLKIKECDPYFFEKIVVDLLEIMYGGDFEERAEVTGKSGDGGIDGIIKQDRLGFNNIYIQAKKWNADVQRPELQKFVGALQGQGAVNGVFFTSSDFTKGAREYVKSVNAATHVVLINGRELAKLMIEYGIGVSEKTKIVIKRVDTDYFHPDGE